MNLELTNITEKDLPLIVFSDTTSGFFEFLIKWRTRGSYNHAMWSAHKGLFASQGNTYSEVPYSRYTTHGKRLKFFQILDLSIIDRNRIISSIEMKLEKPWYKKMYDWLGIVGQVVGVDWLNDPALEYCSEDVAHHIFYMANLLPDNFYKKKILLSIPRHASPEELNEYFKKYPEVFRVYGEWDSDLEDEK